MNITSAACPDPGVWRAWLDHEDSSAHLQAHLDDCPGCRGIVADVRGSAAAAGSLFGQLAPGSLPDAAETAVALGRVKARRQLPDATRAPLQTPAPTPMFARKISTPWRVAASGLAAAVVLSLLVAFTPEGRTAAASFLNQFRSQEVVAFDVTPQTQADIMRAFSTLDHLGTLQFPNGASRPQAAARGADAAPTTRPAAEARGAKSTTSATPAEASQAIGFAVETPDPATLPVGVDKTPRIEVMPASQVRFTFDKNKARTYYQTTGHPEVSLPDKFDGATLVVSIPAAAMLQYGSTTAREALVIGEAGELVVEVQGKVSLAELRDFLLGLPGLPQSTVNQLRQITNSSDTLPIPVPVDKVNWQQTSINGNQGLLLNDNSGAGSAVIWHSKTGHLFGVAGTLKADDLQVIAASVKDRSN